MYLLKADSDVNTHERAFSARCKRTLGQHQPINKGQDALLTRGHILVWSRVRINVYYKIQQQSNKYKYIFPYGVVMRMEGGRA